MDSEDRRALAEEIAKAHTRERNRIVQEFGQRFTVVFFSIALSVLIGIILVGTLLAALVD